MANTTFATGNALTKKLWSEKLIREAMLDVQLSKFMGEGPDNIIQVKKDLIKQKGDKITIGLRMLMSESGGQSSTSTITLLGNETALTFYDYSVSLTEYGNAVRAGGKLDLQRPAFDLRMEMKDALKEWLTHTIEYRLRTALITSPTAGETIDTTGSGGSGLTVANIQKMKRLAQTKSPRLRPVKVDGKDTWLLLAHPLATKSLKADSDWKNAQLYANVRGSKNPLFEGAIGAIDGVVVHEYAHADLLMTNTTVRSIMMGAQAGVLAWGQMPEWHEDLLDVQRIPVVGTDFLAGFGKTVYNSKDYAVITHDGNYTAD